MVLHTEIHIGVTFREEDAFWEVLESLREGTGAFDRKYWSSLMSIVSVEPLFIFLVENDETRKAVPFFSKTNKSK